ncbi:MAG: DUF547 domain-containing protein [Haloferacaceae archaeon]
MSGSPSDERGDLGGAAEPPSSDPVEAARLLLEATRDGEPTGPHLAALADADHDALAPVRRDRATALAFWLNLYNAGTQLLLETHGDLYRSRLGFLRFFRIPCVTVAGTDLGLDDIEQGVLRGSRSKYGLGYLPRVLPGAFERRYRLDEPDPRIHFALNCGAASCPAIRSYTPDRVDDQLDLATRTYLDRTVEYDPASGVARVPRVFLWFRGDFGGGDGIRAFLGEYDAVPTDAAPRLRYLSWDWSPAPGQFVD